MTIKKWMVCTIVFLSVLALCWSCTTVGRRNSLKVVPSETSKMSQEDDDLAYLLSDRPTIDYGDSRLNKILATYDKEPFIYYKAFIEYDKSKKTPLDIEKARSAILDAEKKGKFKYHYFAESADGSLNLDMLDLDVIGLFLILLTSPDIYTASAHSKLPLWLVLKYPDILDLNAGRFSPPVNAKYSIDNVSEFKSLDGILARAIAGYWLAPHGSISRDIDAANRSFREQISFAPNLILEEAEILNPHIKNSIEDNLSRLKAWSSEGLWNHLLYKRFQTAFSEAKIALEKYYDKNYNLTKYKRDSELILSKYVAQILPGFTTEDHRAFKVIVESKGDSNKLKSLAADLTVEDKNELLSRAILSGYDVDIIKWLIENGAEINSSFMDEAPLMNAANNPALLKMLLSLGADVKVQTVFGKTALFYATQFGNIQAINILLDAGSDINKALNSHASMSELTENTPENRYHLETVASFTPLIYAKRYADEKVVQLLQSRGAQMGQADPAIVAKWISEGKLDL